MKTDITNVLKSVQEANDRTIAAATDLNKLATRTQSLLVNKQIAAFQLWLEAGAKQIKSLSEIRTAADSTDLLKNQATAAQELGEKLASNLTEVVEIQTQARDELVKLVQGNIEQAQAVATPGKKTTKATATAKKVA